MTFTATSSTGSEQPVSTRQVAGSSPAWSAKFTKHAKQRWVERFPELDMREQFVRARQRLTKRDWKLVRSRLSHPRHLWLTNRIYRGFYYRKTREGIVFVIAPSETVVTVFPLKEGDA